MLEMNMEGDLSDFDLKRFCDSNPVYCYYFRLPALEAVERITRPEHPPRTLPEDITLPTPSGKRFFAKADKELWDE